MRVLRVLHGLMAALSVFAAGSAMAAVLSSPATVEAVQAPAWLDRQGYTTALVPGTELRNGDVLRTGEGARAYLMLAEGSRVKLGESARFTLYSRSTQPKKHFRGALDLAVGAFRFTTNTIKRVKQHDLTIRVSTATIGIRGTDIWGRADANSELIALLEGRIEIARSGTSTELAQAMTYFEAPRGEAGEIKVLDPELRKTLVRQTEIEPGDGAARGRGLWRAVAGVLPSSEEALELYDQIREAGFAVRVRPHAMDELDAGKGWHYEVALTGFSSEAEARAAAVRLKTLAGVSARVTR